jgi:hypothetical protein
MQWDPASQSNRYTSQELHEHQMAQERKSLADRDTLRNVQPFTYRTQVIIASIAWGLAFAFLMAHGFERHAFPALPYGIPLLITIIVLCLGVMITTRFKFSWMVLSLAAATYAAFNL